MKKISLCLLLALTTSTTWLNAADRKFEKAMIVDNQDHTKILPLRAKVSDAPAPPTEFDHDIAFRLGCSVYIVRYRTELEYLPTALDPGQSIEVSPDKHVVYAKIPGNKDATMSIIRRENAKGDSCNTGAMVAKGAAGAA
jgi:hypothetical protein